MANSMSGYQGYGGKTKIPGYNVNQLPNFTPQQMSQFMQLFKHVGPNSFLSKLAGGDESIFQQVEEPALRQFGELQGGLASRFSGMGTGGRHSSGFQNTMNQAGQDFAMNLQSQRQSLQQQAIKDLMGLSGELLNQRPFENVVTAKPQKSSFWKELVGGVSGAAGQMAGNYGATRAMKNWY